MGDAPTAGSGADRAKRAFEAMAPVYDDFTAHYQYDFWTAQLLSILEGHGLRGHRLLDVGCGTGKSFLPMLRRGWEVVGCDISGSMLSHAQKKCHGAVRLELADMRALPRLGEFDLAWVLDDAVNYLLDTRELEAALSGIRANLAPSGLLLFDVNELLVYRAYYAEGMEIDRGGRRLVWEAITEGEVRAGSLCEFLCYEAIADGENGRRSDRRNTSVHRQRHFTEAEITTAIGRAGLECLGVYGQGTDGIPCQPLDDSVHTKAIYVARAA